MFTQSFRATSLRKALLEAKRALGPEVVIVDTHEHPRAEAGPVYEVVARAGGARQATRAAEPVPSGVVAPAGPLPPELTDLRKLLREVESRLEATERRCVSLVEEVRRLERGLLRDVSGVAVGAPLWGRLEPVVAAIVGAPGVGKTTAVLKIAAAGRVRSGQPVRVAVTPECPLLERRRLEVYCKVMDVGFQVLGSSDGELGELSPGEMVLVDAGPPAASASVPVPHETHLALSARGSAGDHTIGEAPYQGVILTHLDRARPTRSLLDILASLPYPVSHVCHTPGFPGGIEEGGGGYLAAWLRAAG